MLGERPYMLESDLTHAAMRLAYAAHHGQLDKAGVPYIFHPYHLAEQMPDEITVCVALLHDVLEDTSVTLEELEAMFPPTITEAVSLLTRKPDMDYWDYIRALRYHPVARTVKLADLSHNGDASRLACLPPAEQARLQAKYDQARAILEGVLP